MAYPTTTPETDFDPKRFWMTIIGICAVIIFGSIFVTRSYMKRRAWEGENYRPPHIAKLEVDLEAINRDGNAVSLGELFGKAWVMGYMYTDCPSGCLGLSVYLEQLHDKFGEREDFQLVSVSLNPSEDTPEKISAWIDNHGIAVPASKWWFLTGDETKIRDYMLQWFHMPYGEESDDPLVVAAQGKFQHQPMLVIVDEKANIRGYYRVMQDDVGEQEFQRLQRDLEHVFEEAEEAEKNQEGEAESKPVAAPPTSLPATSS